MTVTEPSAHPWLRLYEDRARPLHVRSADVEGDIPAGLRGTHYRVGPAGGRSYGTPLANAFADADGFVAAYTFTDSGVSLRGDLVRTPVRRREQAAGRLIGATFSTLADRRLPTRLFTGLRGIVASFAPGILPPQAGWEAVKDSPNHVP
jgi:carotenoid cleavage dioxygenase-like enzyme